MESTKSTKYLLFLASLKTISEAKESVIFQYSLASNNQENAFKWHFFSVGKSLL